MCARKRDWFDDFMLMKMMEENEAKNKQTQQPTTGGYAAVFDDGDELSDEEREERLDALNDELSNLETELLELEFHEPIGGDSNGYDRWEQRKALLEEQMDAVRSEIEELEA